MTPSGAPTALLLLLLLLLLVELGASSNCSGQQQQQQQQQQLQQLQYYLWGYAATILSGFGLVGNSVSIVVLTSPRMLSSTSIYLVALGAMDIVVLLLFDICMGLPLVSTAFAAAAQPDSALIKVLYPISLFVHMSNMYITMCFTVERYLSIKFPLRSASWCTRRRAKRVVACVLAFTLVYNVPRAFEKIGPAQRQLQRNNWYRRIYSGAMYSLFMYVLPMLVITVANVLLIHAVRLATRRSQGSIGGKEEQHKRQERDFSISLMLASVVAVFIFCQTFAVVDNLTAAVLQTPAEEASALQQVVYVVAQFMIVANSSVNFVLYCFFGAKFRRELRLIVCRRLLRGRAANRSQRAISLNHEMRESRRLISQQQQQQQQQPQTIG